MPFQVILSINKTKVTYGNFQNLMGGGEWGKMGDLSRGLELGFRENGSKFVDSYFLSSKDLLV